MTKLLFAFFIALIPLRLGYAQDLMELYRLALENDPTFKSADIQRLVTEETQRQDIAMMLPQITFSASSEWNRLNTKSFLGSHLQHFWNNQLGVNLVQPAFHLDQWIQLDQSDNQIAQTEAQYQAALQELISRTAEHYFNVLAAEENLKYMSAYKIASERELIKAKEGFSVGAAAETNLFQAEAAFEQAVADEVDARTQLENNRDRLRKITSVDSPMLNHLQPELPISPPDPDDITEWTNSALSNNFSIIAQINQCEYTRKSVYIEQAQHLPVIDIVAKYSQLNSANGNLYGINGDNEYYGLQMSLPLYQGGGTESKVRQAEDNYRISQEDLIKIQRSVSNDVKESFRGMNSSISKIRALKASITSAEKFREAAETGFNIGKQSLIDVLNAERAYFKAKSNYSRSLFDYLIYGVKLKLANGSLSDEDVKHLNKYLVKY